VITYRFDITHHSDGKHSVTHDGQTAHDSHTMARLLVAAGKPDGLILAGRPGKNDWTHMLHRHAGLTTRDDDVSTRTAIYAPHPRSEPHPLVQRAILACTEARSRRVKAQGR
jgi:hypothetical protein